MFSSEYFFDMTFPFLVVMVMSVSVVDGVDGVGVRSLTSTFSVVVLWNPHPMSDPFMYPVYMTVSLKTLMSDMSGVPKRLRL